MAGFREVDGTAAVLAQVHRNHDGIAAAKHPLPAREVESGGIPARGRGIFGYRDVPCIRHGSEELGCEGGQAGARLFPRRTVRLATWLGKGAGTVAVQ
eukprot:9929389-Heterocapsa_arctica.AAC.1